MTLRDPVLDVGALYSDHHPWLERWLRSRLGNACDAADLAQDTFVRVLAARRTAIAGEPRAYLTHIAKNLVVDRWRRQEVERAYLQAIAHLPEPQAPSPEARLIILESLVRIEAMLRGMPARTQEVFLLAQLDGVTYVEIASRFGMPLITVKRHMRKAFGACLAVA